MASFVLAQLFLFLHHPKLIGILAESIILGDPSISRSVLCKDSPQEFADYLLRYPESCKNECDTTSDAIETVPLKPFDPVGMSLAQSLVNASLAIRCANSAPMGLRLPTYLQHSVSAGHSLTFTQPPLSLEKSLSLFSVVTPDLFDYVWPNELGPLEFAQGGDDVS